MFKAKMFLILPALLLLLFLPPEISAQKNQDVVGKVGFGAGGDLSFPVFGLRNRFRMTGTWGGFLTYAKGSHTTLEVEYHRTRFDPGKLEQSTFYWPEGNPTKWKLYKSPLARNFMIINAFTVNGLYHFVDRIQTGHEGPRQQITAGPYITYGGGFYHYTNSISGLIFAGQSDKGTGLDDTLLLDPLKETNVGWGVNLGVGVEVLMGDKAGLDVRGRYHLIIGELRQMDAYRMERTYPMNYFDFGISMKYYLGRL